MSLLDEFLFEKPPFIKHLCITITETQIHIKLKSKKLIYMGMELKMKNTFNSAVLAALVMIFSISVSSYCSTPEDELDGKNSAASEKLETGNTQKEIKKKSEPKDVLNVWKDMPSYDRFGNEITARARKNMLENALLQKQANNNTESDEVKK